jgi:hypothetical protein
LKLRMRIETPELPRRAADDAARAALGRTASTLDRASLALSSSSDAYRCRVLLVSHTGVRAASEAHHRDGLEAVRRATSRAARRITFAAARRGAISEAPTNDHEREAS